MRKRLVVAAICIFALPLLFSASQSGKPIALSPYATVALAGHTNIGGWCPCGTPGCISDPGEICGNNNVGDTDEQTDSAPTDPGAASDIDHGAGILMLALAFLLWVRLRV